MSNCNLVEKSIMFNNKQFIYSLPNLQCGKNTNAIIISLITPIAGAGQYPVVVQYIIPACKLILFVGINQFSSASIENNRSTALEQRSHLLYLDEQICGCASIYLAMLV